MDHSREGGARQVVVAARPGDHVILDADATERAQLLHARPVDRFAEGLALRLIQQLVDDVEARLHGDDRPVFELAREPQERMIVWTLDLATAGLTLSAADVVYLQTEQMADAMRIEHAGQPGVDRLIR